MCGRYTLGNVDTINSRFNLDIEEVYEVFPSNQILVKADSIFMVSWSFSPFWAKESIKLINARYETLKDKPSFKNTKRCGIFTNGWFEWKSIGGKKKPFYHFTNEEYFFLGGVYNQHGCVIVTKEAEGALRNIHNRMPLFFSDKDLDLWLKEKDACLFNNNPSSKIKIKEINSIQQINSFLKSI